MLQKCRCDGAEGKSLVMECSCCASLPHQVSSLSKVPALLSNNSKCMATKRDEIVVGPEVQFTNVRKGCSANVLCRRNYYN